MDDRHLYQQIVEAIRQEILSGELKPGERLPSVRQMTTQWGCTNATVLRAYQELARQGLVVSRVGQGTKVTEKPPIGDQQPLRRAMLLNRIEANLLEIMTAGFSPDEVEQAMRMALDRWRSFSALSDEVPTDTLRFVGSHDPAVTLIAAHAHEIRPGMVISLSFTGSLGGLIALAEKEADIAGCHLWDQESSTYNIPFVRRLFPGQKIALLTLSLRRVGLLIPRGNPHGIAGLEDLARPGVRMINRQPGSGTRVWLDAQLKQMGIDTRGIAGYQDERKTHSEVASAIAKGQGNTGLGVQTAALAYGLDFIMFTTERYELAIPEEVWQRSTVQSLCHWINTDSAKTAIDELGGYDVSETGNVHWVE
jgi:molybdate-binding protein/DNA-binding transcriptional regulator YhcF (GntR family)